MIIINYGYEEYLLSTSHPYLFVFSYPTIFKIKLLL